MPRELLTTPETALGAVTDGQLEVVSENNGGRSIAAHPITGAERPTAKRKKGGKKAPSHGYHVEWVPPVSSDVKGENRAPETEVFIPISAPEKPDISSDTQGAIHDETSADEPPEPTAEEMERALRRALVIDGVERAQRRKRRRL